MYTTSYFSDNTKVKSTVFIKIMAEFILGTNYSSETNNISETLVILLPKTDTSFRYKSMFRQIM